MEHTRYNVYNSFSLRPKIVFVWSLCWRKLETLEDDHLSDIVTEE